MHHQIDVDELLRSISEEETLEAQRNAVAAEGGHPAEVRRLDRLIVKAMKHEVAAEGGDDLSPGS